MRISFGMRCKEFGKSDQDLEGLCMRDSAAALSWMIKEGGRVFLWIGEIAWWCLFPFGKGVLFWWTADTQAGVLTDIRLSIPEAGNVLNYFHILKP